MSSYHPETYWSEVAERIDQREGSNVIAGDDEPYYEYKRQQFLKKLKTIDFNGKSVLEIGCGPGGNLIEINKLSPNKLHAVDISEKMVNIARANTKGCAEIYKTNGTKLPFGDKSYDIIITSTVLQHNTDEKMLTALIKELSRASSNDVYLFERVESMIKGDDLCLGRPVDYYASLMNDNGFKLVRNEFLETRISYFICGGIRKLANPSSRKEGEPLTKIATLLQRISLPITKALDRLLANNRDVAMMHFRRIE